MSRTTIAFLIASLVYFAITALLGLLMAAHFSPLTARMAMTHVHFGLLGFFGMMVYGVGYHILPRFRGRPLRSERLAWVQFWLASISLLGLGALFPFAVYRNPEWNLLKMLFVVFAAGQAISIFMFVHNMLFTLLPLTPIELPPALAAARARVAAQQEKKEN